MPRTCPAHAPHMPRTCSQLLDTMQANQTCKQHVRGSECQSTNTMTQLSSRGRMATHNTQQKICISNHEARRRTTMPQACVVFSNGTIAPILVAHCHEKVKTTGGSISTERQWCPPQWRQKLPCPLVQVLESAVCPNRARGDETTKCRSIHIVIISLRSHTCS